MISIQKLASRMARRLRPCNAIDSNDLAQESEMFALRGRKSIKGPMQDLMRREFSPLERVSLSDNLRVDGTPESIYATRELEARVNAAVDALPGRLCFVVRMVFWRGVEKVRIARQLKVSGGRVTQMENEALKRLRRKLRRSVL